MIAVAGCPRSGTTYMATILKEAGLKVAHERNGAFENGNGEQGMVGWPALFKPMDYEKRILLVREPLAMISSYQSIQRLFWDSQLGKFFKIQRGAGGKIEFSISWYSVFADMIVQVEQVESRWPEIAEFLGCGIMPPQSLSLTRINSRQHTDLTWNDLKNINYRLTEMVMAIGSRFGYKNL